MQTITFTIPFSSAQIVFLPENYGKNMKKAIFIGYYGYWVILTYAGILSAVFGVYFAFTGGIRNALICMMISGVCDTFDGRVARLKKRDERQLNYGIQIDSMADLIAFGLLPVAIGYALGKSHGSYEPINAVYAAIYVLAALIRLSYFNAIEAELQNKNKKRTYFEGLPTTSVALIIPIVYSICSLLQKPFSEGYNIMLAIISVLFVLRIKIPKPKFRGQVILCLFGLPVVFYMFWSGGL